MLPFDSPAPFLAEFGADALLAGQPVRGIFDRAAGDALGFVRGSDLSFLMPDTSAVPVEDQLLVIGGTTYRISRADPDGTGWYNLSLEEQS